MKGSQKGGAKERKKLIERESERDRETATYIHKYTHTHTYIYIYIYTYFSQSHQGGDIFTANDIRAGSLFTGVFVNTFNSSVFLGDALKLVCNMIMP